MDECLRLIERSSPLSFSENLLQTDLAMHKKAAEGLEQLPSPPSSPSRRQRLLVCHDMRGNYLSDAYTRGHRFGDAFQITDWSFIDIFCYFSHNLISLPPIQWIRVCHKHRVQVMGTFLTEWEAGREVCRELFKDEDGVSKLSTLLSQLAEVYKLDGWLINIENPLDPLIEVPMMKGFLKQLSQEMHRINPQSLVIWYDAVTTEGRLRWQNRVNSRNRDFLDCCDGMFINYGWNGDTPIVSSLFAGIDRRHDIFFGIDVWGRGTFGGGRHNCDHALRVLRRLGVSAALFAPGYVLECEVNEDMEPLQVQCEIMSKYALFWERLKVAWASYKEQESVPFYVNFSQAAGSAVYVHGRRFTHWAVPQTQNSWFYDLSLQHLNFDMSAMISKLESLQCSIVYDRGVDGTSSLNVKGSCSSHSQQCLSLNRFSFDLNEAAVGKFTICCVIEPLEMACPMGVFIETGSRRFLTTKYLLQPNLLEWEVWC